MFLGRLDVSHYRDHREPKPSRAVYRSTVG
jgi:hypothetical protein